MSIDILVAANFVLMCVNLLLLPALLVRLCCEKPEKGGAALQYLAAAALLFLLTRATAFVPVELLRLLPPSLKSRFYTLFYTVVALFFIAAFYLLKNFVSIKMEFHEDGGEAAPHPCFRAAGLALGSAVFALALAVLMACRCVVTSLKVSIREILYTITAPLKGGAMRMVLFQGIPPAILVVIFALLYVSVGRRVFLQRRSGDWILTAEVCQRRGRLRLTRRLPGCMLLFSGIALLASLAYADHSLQIRDYISSLRDSTTLYEDYYVEPADTRITGEGKNLLYIYLESMETSYASVEEGGWQPENNYIPGLTALAKENLAFSNSEKLGGFRPVQGTEWTMGSIFASTSGIPFTFPIGKNNFSNYQNVATGVYTLGEILEEKGYQNEFLCGSDGDFAGRKDYFLQHGGYKVYDLYTARENGVVPEDYYVWWGFEDEILYKIAKDELLRLAGQDKPFNLTMLTVDTHFADGYICDLCQQDYDTVAENVVSCADRQLTEFIEWCRQQDFYKDTLIVITGDHPRMDLDLVDGVERYADRTVYNCFLNCGREARTANREFTAMDMFPTVLSAMGFQIEGDRLGLGVNLFSDEQTLCEKMGYYPLSAEIGKYSAFYMEHFG